VKSPVYSDVQTQVSRKNEIMNLTEAPHCRSIKHVFCSRCWGLTISDIKKNYCIGLMYVSLKIFIHKEAANRDLITAKTDVPLFDLLLICHHTLEGVVGNEKETERPEPISLHLIHNSYQNTY